MHIKKITSAILAAFIALSISTSSIFADSTAIVTTSTLNVRSGPSTSNTIVTKIYENNIVTIIGTSNGWYNVRLSNGQTGWVSGQYLKIQGNTDMVGYANVSMTLDEYIDSQVAKTNKSIEVLKPYIDPNNFTIEDKQTFMQFLRIDKFREIDVQGLNNYLNSLGSNNIFYNQGQAFIDASRKYNIDPIYLVAHTLHETGFGTSNLARGYYVVLGSDGQIANILDPNTTPSPGYIKVHNLFGIGAIDADPKGGGVKTAYENGWTSIPAAIDGSAKWIKEGYIYRSSYAQNTVYKMRFDYVGTWHQYATDLNWAKKISQYMNDLSYLYLATTLEFEVPKYATPSYTIPAIGDKPIETKYVYDTASVNVRSGPGSNFRDVGDLAKDTAIGVYGYTSNGWAIIKINGEVRYVSAIYLTSISPATANKVYYLDINSFLSEESAIQATNKLKADTGWYAEWRLSKKESIYNIRTGEFFGEESAKKGVETIKNVTGFNATYKHEGQYTTPTKTPLYRIETGGFIGEESVKKALNWLKNESGWWATYEPTGTRINEFRIETGGFVGEENVKNALNSLKAKSGWWATYEPNGNRPNEFKIVTGGFTGEQSAKNALNWLQNETGWWATYKSTGNSYSEYRIVTGEFSGEENVNSALNWLKGRSGWWANYKFTGNYEESKGTPIYHLYIENLIGEAEASRVLQNLKQQTGWYANYNFVEDRSYYHIITGGFLGLENAKRQSDFITNTYRWYNEIKE